MYPEPFKKVWFDMMRLMAFMDEDDDGLTPEERLYQARDLLFMMEKKYSRALTFFDVRESKAELR